MVRSSEEPATAAAVSPTSTRSLWSRLRAALAATAHPRTIAPIDDAQWAALHARLPWVAGLDAERADRLRALGARFLADKTITPAGALTLDAHQRQILAVLCCLPVLEFGYGGLRGWSQLIVYADTFRAHRSHYDDHTGLVHEGTEDLAGEAWQFGPVVLSWGDIEQDLADPGAGFNVAIHEIAHKLDALDGHFDGTPPLPAAWRARWITDFQAAFDTHVARIERGAATPIDAYAAEAPDEFFAVTSEYHFSAPRVLAQAMPAVAAHLQRFYGPSPLAR